MGNKKQTGDSLHSGSPRAELHIHTKMSWDSLVDIDELMRTAAEQKMAAVAVTDAAGVWAFPAVAKAAAEYHQKVIYGVETFMVLPKLKTEAAPRYTPVSILVKNKKGLENLYELVSIASMKGFGKIKGSTPEELMVPGNFAKLPHFIREGRDIPFLSRKELERCHEGLLYGCPAGGGEIVYGLLSGIPEEKLVEAAGFYDYLEVEPWENFAYLIGDSRETYEDFYPDFRHSHIRRPEDLKEVLRTLVSIGEKAHRPVCAVSDAHYLTDGEYDDWRLYHTALGTPGAEELPPLRLRTTEDMLAAFGELPQNKAEEIVIRNPLAIADQCENIPIFTKHRKFDTSSMPEAYRYVRFVSFTEAWARYGNPLPLPVQKRLEEELASIRDHDKAAWYEAACRIVHYLYGRGRHRREADWLTGGTRGNGGASLAAFLLGLTEVNPLPAHYVCPVCHWTEFPEEGKDGFDLPVKTCPHCGHPLVRDGHDIPFAMLAGPDGGKTPYFHMLFPKKLWVDMMGRPSMPPSYLPSGAPVSVAGEYADETGVNEDELLTDWENDSLFLYAVDETGSFVPGLWGVPHRTCLGRLPHVWSHLEKLGVPHDADAMRAAMETLLQRLSGVRWDTEVSPMGLLFDPSGELQPYQVVENVENSDGSRNDVVVSSFDCVSLVGEGKMDIGVSPDPTMTLLWDIQEMTGAPLKSIPLDDAAVWSLFRSPDALGIRPGTLEHWFLYKGDTSHITGTLGIPGFSGKNAWDLAEELKPSSFRDLVKLYGWLHSSDSRGRTEAADVSCFSMTRDDVYRILVRHGMDTRSAYEAMEHIRRGMGNPVSEKQAAELGLPRHLMKYWSYAGYLPPESQAVSAVLSAYRLAWYKLYCPLAFYAVWFTVCGKGQANAWNLAQGLDYLSTLLPCSREGMDLSGRPPDEGCRMAVELYLRGFYFRPINRTRSDVTWFTMEEGALLLPLTSIGDIAEQVPGEAIDRLAQYWKDVSLHTDEDIDRFYRNMNDLYPHLGDIVSDMRNHDLLEGVPRWH